MSCSPLRMLDDTGAGLSGWIDDEVDWAAAEGADVISLSLGAPAVCPRLRDAVRRAAARGVIAVAAAGNGGLGRNTVEYPGAFPEVVYVGAVDGRLAVANFSGRGPEVDAVAPGASVRGTYPGDRVATMSGTSMAAPYVAGVAALYVAGRRAEGRTPTPAEFRRLLEASIASRGRRCPSPRAGWRLIQAGGFIGSDRVPTPKELVLTPDVWSRACNARPDYQGAPLKFDVK